MESHSESQQSFYDRVDTLKCNLTVCPGKWRLNITLGGASGCAMIPESIKKLTRRVYLTWNFFADLYKIRKHCTAQTVDFLELRREMHFLRFFIKLWFKVSMELVLTVQSYMSQVILIKSLYDNDCNFLSYPIAMKVIIHNINNSLLFQ